MTAQSKKGNNVFVIALLAVFAGLASVVLLANDFRNLNAILSRLGLPTIATSANIEAPLPVPQSAEALAPVIPIPEGMMESPVIPPQHSFRRTITRGRDDICAALQKAGWVGQDWQLDEIGVRAWSCGAEKAIFSHPDPTTLIGTLFVSARGPENDKVSSVRLKINFLDNDLSGPVLYAALSAIEDIFHAIGWGADPEIKAKLQNLEPFERPANGNTISLNREFGDVPRYNFLIVSDQQNEK